MGITLSNSISSSESVLAGLSGGYVVTQSGSGNPSGTLKLRPASALSTTSSTVTLTTTFPDAYCYNNSGIAYIMTSAGNPTSTTTRTLRSLTQSGGTLSMTSIGSFTMATGATTISAAYMDSSGAQSVIDYTGTTDVSGITTSTGALAWTASLAGHTFSLVAACGSDQFLVRCNTHSNIELWNGSTNTLLSSIARDATRSFAETIIPISATTFFYAIQVTSTRPAKIRYGLLSTSGGTLSWSWGTTDLTTAWDDGATTDYQIVTSAWGTNALVATRNRVFSGSYLSVPFYVIDTSTQAVTTSDSSTILGQGAYPFESMYAGPSYIVIHDWDTYGTISSWGLPTSAHTYLRQRQSPLRTPSRIRGAALRARQTPYTT